MSTHSQPRRSQGCRPVRGRTGWRALGAWVSLILLLLDVAAGGVLPARSAEAGSLPVAQELDGDHIVLCTAAGMVELGPDGTPISGHPQDHRSICVFCLPLMAGGVSVPPSGFTLAALPSGRFLSRPVFTLAAPVVPLQLAGTSSPRAPPFA